MQEKKINKKIYRERERERERENLFVRENYVKNGKKNKKFIVNCVNKKIQNKGRWRVILN